MISAKDARQLTDVPKEQRIFEKLDAAVRLACKQGNKNVSVNEEYMKSVLDHLVHLGFSVRYTSDHRDGNFYFIEW